eukprot:TRINITY_DN54871_c0_g1_i1.p1 TRINITY_DN54871_c0_g1~~TRINITY_DN54871_c0_g1_i1.p1  ORF type:complete len:222 (+),score=73.12 TRINITY_DN54871_c0_g1_i1:82-747(+)
MRCCCSWLSLPRQHREPRVVHRAFARAHIPAPEAETVNDQIRDLKEKLKDAVLSGKKINEDDEAKSLLLKLRELKSRAPAASVAAAGAAGSPQETAASGAAEEADTKKKKKKRRKKSKKAEVTAAAADVVSNEATGSQTPVAEVGTARAAEVATAAADAYRSAGGELIDVADISGKAASEATCTNVDGATALHLAAASGSEAIIMLLRAENARAGCSEAML